MKLANELKKAMGLMLISTMILSAAPVMAADYDNHWAKEAIDKWHHYEVVTGYGEGIFKPNKEVTRAELAAFISRVFRLESTKDATNFSDVAAEAWYKSDVEKVSSAGIMQGAAGKFNPNGFATRQEVAVTLVNAFSLSGGGALDFNDEEEIGAWAKDAVATLVANVYASGRTSNQFAPTANITRAEVMQLLDNIVKQLVNQPGTYNSNISGNVVINTKDVVLEGIKVKGNVYLAQGIGLGDATLKNTEVSGKVVIAGGGVNSVRFDKVAVDGGILVSTKEPVRLVAQNSSLKVVAAAKQKMILTGHFKEVIVPADVVLELKGASVDSIVVQASGEAAATITVDKESIIKDLKVQAPAQIAGDGKITLLKVEANGIMSVIKPDEVQVGEGYDKPKLPSSEGGGGGGSTNTDKKEITVKSITLNQGVSLPASALKINGNDITLDLGASGVPETIESLSIAFDNLKAGTHIKTSVNVLDTMTKELTDTVEADGKVTYRVSTLRDYVNARKSKVIELLNTLKCYDQVELLLSQAGLSLKDVYLKDGTINVAQVKAKSAKLAEVLESNQSNSELTTAIHLINTFLDQFGASMNQSNASVTGRITLSSDDNTTQSTAYTVTIKY